MARPSPWRIPARLAPWIVAAVAVLSISSAWAGLPASSSAATPGARPAAATVPANDGPASPHPAAASQTFYHLTPDIAAQSPSKQFCSYSSTASPRSVDRYCFPQAQNPSALHLANGNIAVAYSVLTNYTTTTCAAPANATNSRIGISVSSDGGLSFGGITYLGNNSCPYLNAIEPSFGVSNTGTVYGAFVEENYSNVTNPLAPGLPPNYGSRSGDGLGFVASSDNATTWSPVRTIPVGGNIARPALATIGDTVYVTYTDVANGTGGIGLPPSVARVNPVAEAVRMVVSTDGGSNWSSPITLPSENATENWTSFGASIAVSSTGTVAVAYATDRSCLVSYLGYSCTSTYGWTYGENVVVTTSDDNGSSWHGPYTVGWPSGEAACYDYSNESYLSYPYPPPCLAYLFELTPQTTIAFGATNQTIFVAWSGEHAPYFNPTENSNISAAVSTNEGKNWKATSVENPKLNNQINAEEYSTPALGYYGGRVYLAYLDHNSTTCFISIYCSLMLSSYTEWVTSSTNGQSWTQPTFVALSPGSAPVSPTEYYDSFSGFSGSVTFTTSGSPVLAFSLDTRPDSQQAVVNNVSITQYEFGASLDVAVGAAGPTVNLTFQLHGAPTPRAWSFSIDDVNFSEPSNVTSALVAGVPADQPVKIEGPGALATGYWTELEFVASVPEFSSFAANATVVFNATDEYGLAFSWVPAGYIGLCMCLTLNGAYYIAIPIFGGYIIQEPNFPWYFPKGEALEIQPQINQGTDPSLYYVGNGSGSYTGPGTWANVTMDGPVNETVWSGLLGNSSLGVQSAGLPSGTAYNFSVDGTPHTGVAGKTTYVSDLHVGPHVVSDAWAAGTGGDEWIGTPSTTTAVVPYETNVTLSFADVNLSSPVGNVAFRAVGVPDGTAWTISFNGTLYTSDSTTLNVSSRSGTFPFASYSTVASSGTSGYAPTTLGPSIGVRSGGTTDVNFTAAYNVVVEAGLGGDVAGAPSQWVAPGATVALNATPLPGYRFVEWSGSGNGSYSGTLRVANATANGPLQETAVFAVLPAARFNLTFTEVGLPTGTYWSADLSGQSYATNQTTLAVHDLYSCSDGASGLYALGIPDATDAQVAGIRYVPSATNSTVCTTGTTSVPVDYSTQYLANVTASLSNASVSATCGFSVGVSVWCDSGTSVGLSAPTLPGETFTGWVGQGPGAYTGPTADASFTPTGPVQELATYEPTPPAPTYVVTLGTRPGFASGTTWVASALGKAYASSGPVLLIPGQANGTLVVTLNTATSPDGNIQYAPVSLTVTVHVAGNTSRTVNYSLAYRGSISTEGGGTVGPAAGWFAANSTVRLSASSNPGETFLGWTGTGGGYTGSDPNGTFTVSAPFDEVAAFGPTATRSTTAPSSSSIWSSPLLWAGLAAVGLVVGLAVGMIAVRRGRPPSRSFEEPSTASGPPDDAPTSEGP